MKELSIEEKAKAYDEAKARISKAYNDNRCTIGFMNEIFPELKESEDERVRNKLIEFFKGYSPDEEWWGNITQEDILAWIEKQGKQKPADKVEPKFKVGDWVVCEVMGSVSQIKNCIENLSNHKCGYDLTNGGYICSDEVDHYHLWTIQDAKDGDVLYECNEKKPFIFKELKTKHIGDIASYCDIFNGIFNPNEDSWTTLDIVPAAKEQRELLFKKMEEAGYEWDSELKEVKKNEQSPKWKGIKDLEAAILAAHPTFEQKSVGEEIVEALRTEYEKGRADAIAQIQKEWSEEDEEHINYLIEVFDGQQYHQAHSDEELVNWLKSLKQRYFWKPNGKNEKLTDVNHEYFSELLESDDSKDINDYAYQVAYCISHDWLKETATWDDVEKACKLGAEWNKRHHKSAWSDEDKKMIGRIRSIVEKYAFSQSAVDVNGDLCEKEYIDADNWLKSLKDRVYPKQEWKQENTDDLTDFENAMMHIGESFFGKNAGLDPNDIDAIKEQANTLLGLVPSKEWSEGDDDDAWMNDIISKVETNLQLNKAEIDWLKSLKNRYSWKPSDEQITVLELASKYERVFTPKQIDILIGLKEQLKKLKKEEV